MKLLRLSLNMLAGLALVAAAYLIRVGFLSALGGQAPYTTFYPAVVLSALFLGTEGGVAAILGASFTADYFILQPVGSLAISDPQALAGWIAFLVTGGFVCLIAAVFKESRRRLQNVTKEKDRLQESVNSREALAHLSFELGLVLRAGGYGVWTWDVEIDQSFWDEQMFRLYHREPSEGPAEYESWLRYLHPDDRDRSRETRRLALEGIAEYNTEFRIVWPDGSIHHMRSFAAFERSADGKVLKEIGLNQDVTAEKQAFETLKESEYFLRESQRVSTTGSFKVDFASGTWKSSEVLDEILGLETKAERTIGSWLELVHPEDRAVLEGRFQEEIRGGTGRLPKKEYRIVRKAGEVRWVLREGEVSVDRSGRPIVLIGTIQDITEKKALEAERAQLAEELVHVQKMENLGQVAGGVAHDLNNTLATILTSASAKTRVLPPSDPNYKAFERIAGAAEQGGKMVNSLLGFARRERVEKKTVDLNLLIQEQLGFIRTPGAEIKVEVRLDPGLRSILGDAGALRSAFVNVVLNAFDAMPDGGVLTITTSNRDEESVEVSLRDTGVGMSEEVLNKALDPFFTTKGVGKGTGLGLALVYRTLESHQGNLTLESKVGQGTTVRMVFPSGRKAEIQPSPDRAKPERQGPRMNILVVDDDSRVRESIVEGVQSLSHLCFSAESGQRALELFESEGLPDLVILDLDMDGLSGKQTLEKLRETAPLLPVILSTGRTDQNALDLMNSNTKVWILQKPYTIEELAETLELARTSLPSLRPQ